MKKGDLLYSLQIKSKPLVMSHPFHRGLEVVRDTAGTILKDINCSVYLVQELIAHTSKDTEHHSAFETVEAGL